MSKISEEDIVFINTVAETKEYLPYTVSSIKDRKIAKNPKVFQGIKKVLDSKVPISSIYKNKALEAIAPDAGSDGYKTLKEEILSRKTEEGDSYYKTYAPPKAVMEIITPLTTSIKRVKVSEKEDRKQEFEFLADAELEVIQAEEDSEYLFGLADDFLDEYKKKGYTEEQQRVINEKLKLLPPTQEGRNKALEVLRTMKLLLVPDDDPFLSPAEVSFPTIVEEVNQSVEIPENPPSTTVETLSENVAMTPEPPNEEPVTSSEPMPIQQPLEASLSSGGSGLKPFKERYHPNSLQLYFGSSTYPDWDLELETSVQKLELTTKGVVMFMDDIIKQYGPKIFVSERKSDTREELNELMQLQFTILRSLKKPFKGGVGATATVKLADLIKIDRLANNSGNPTSAEGLVVNPINPLPVASAGTQIVTSRSEDAFIKNYDNYITQQNLNISRNERRVVPIPVLYGQDPRNVEIIPGNNLISVKRNQVRRM